jgi:hypothetical protein
MPRLEVFLKEKGKEVAGFKFGGESRSPGGIFLKSSASSIFVVDKDLYAKLNIRWSDILEATPGPETPAK